MRKIRLLVLTDHSKHSAQNSLYAIVRAFHKLGKFTAVDIASRGNPLNIPALVDLTSSAVYVHSSQADFSYASANADIERDIHPMDIADYDFLLLRIPRPLPPDFFKHLITSIPATRIFNNPHGIEKTSSKEFLVNFPDLTPPLKLCHNMEDVLAFAETYDTVIKPLKDYGGHGIMRINDRGYWEGNTELTKDAFEKRVLEQGFPLLAMKFMKNVHKGDKRIVVAGGEILTSTLRIPQEDSWMCNVAQGAQAVTTDITEREEEIIRVLDRILRKEGIIIYGVDTLEDEDGLRYLSEINTLSIGGIGPADKLLNKPVTLTAVQKLWEAMRIELNIK